MRPFTLDQIVEGAKRTPQASSLGSDGLPYLILYILFQQPLLGSLVVDIYNDALLAGIFPASWSETRLYLLLKKEDLLLLSNWRPISLINANAKVLLI